MWSENCVRASNVYTVTERSGEEATGEGRWGAVARDRERRLRNASAQCHTTHAIPPQQLGSYYFVFLIVALILEW